MRVKMFEPITIEEVIKTENLSPEIKMLMEKPTTFQVVATPVTYLHRLPRKLKKAVKSMRVCKSDYGNYEWTYRRNTKWKRKANSLLMVLSEPILKIPHFTQDEIARSLKEWQ